MDFENRSCEPGRGSMLQALTEARLKEAPSPLETGLCSLDRLLGGGIPRNDVTVVVSNATDARERVAFIAEVAHSLAKSGVRVVFAFLCEPSLPLAVRRVAGSDSTSFYYASLELEKYDLEPLQAGWDLLQSRSMWGALSEQVSGCDETVLVLDDIAMVDFDSCDETAPIRVLKGFASRHGWDLEEGSLSIVAGATCSGCVDHLAAAGAIVSFAAGVCECMKAPWWHYARS